MRWSLLRHRPITPTPRTVALARDRLGGVDIMVNNAGVAELAPLHEISLREPVSWSPTCASKRAGIKRAGAERKPVQITYDPKTGHATLADGNHRLEMAQAAGRATMPVKVVAGTVPVKSGVPTPHRPTEIGDISPAGIGLTEGARARPVKEEARAYHPGLVKLPGQATPRPDLEEMVTDAGGRYQGVSEVPNRGEQVWFNESTTDSTAMLPCAPPCGPGRASRAPRSPARSPAALRPR